MTADPLHELVVLLALVAGYTALGAAVWFIVCSRSNSAVKHLNAAIAKRTGPVFSVGSSGEAEPDLETTLAALVAEDRLPAKLAARLRRIAPIFHDGRWAAYPSAAYWSYRYERLHSR